MTPAPIGNVFILLYPPQHTQGQRPLSVPVTVTAGAAAGILKASFLICIIHLS
jgi:hypothetical protein